jgi:transcriptional regulator GlxA family with amidase domain
MVMAFVEATSRGGLAPWQLARVGGHIERGLASRLTNSRLASLVRLSEDHFARAFKASIGCSPHAYVVMRRIERAKALMLTSDLPLSQIAVAAGFSDQSHLSRCFRNKVGAAPALWRAAEKGTNP